MDEMRFLIEVEQLTANQAAELEKELMKVVEQFGAYDSVGMMSVVPQSRNPATGDWENCGWRYTWDEFWTQHGEDLDSEDQD